MAIGSQNGVYETPEITCFKFVSEGVLCGSGDNANNTNEGVKFEDWN